jgi:hypothetical protein
MSAPRRILNSIFTDNPVRLSEVVDSELKSRIGSLLESKKLQVVSEMFDSGDFSPNAIKESVKSNRQKLRESVISAIAEEINESEVEEGIVDRYFTKSGRAHAAARDILKSIKHAKKTKRVAKEKDVKEEIDISHLGWKVASSVSGKGGAKKYYHPDHGEARITVLPDGRWHSHDSEGTRYANGNDAKSLYQHAKHPGNKKENRKYYKDAKKYEKDSAGVKESILDRFYSRQSKERKQPAAKGLKFKTKTKRVAKAQDKE